MRGDGVYRRPGSPYWYYKLKDNGHWHEVSTKTRNYQKARQLRRDAMKSLEEGRLVIGGLARLPFEAVAAKYLQAASLRLRESTLKKERLFLVRSIHLFGCLKCDQLTAAEIFRLQETMKRDGCTNTYVNLVVDATARILRFARVWQRIGPQCKAFARAHSADRACAGAGGKERLFRVAASNPAWLTAYAAALIAVNTTLRGCELKGLKWTDVDLLERTVRISDSKTDAGLRRIPLNDGAMLGFRLLRDRSAKLGACDGGNYVFPACEHGLVDPNRPQRSWRSAWRSLTDVAGLKGLRFHDMRHQCITELAEQGHADQTVMAIAGHLSRRMLEHYSHVRLDAKRKALESLPTITTTDPAEDQTTDRPN